MAVLQTIRVPLVSVNDKSLTVIETPFSSGDKINEGDVIVTFETSKTTYDIEAEVSGYIQYLCVAGEDYETNTAVILIYDSASDVKSDLKPTRPYQSNEDVRQERSQDQLNWNGKTLFSNGALELMSAHRINETEFAGYDLVNKEDIQLYLEKTLKKISPDIVTQKENTKSPGNISFDQTNLIAEKLSSNKKREIRYLGAVQSAGLTSSINTFINTRGIFVHLNESLKALKDSLLPVTVYETSRLLGKYRELNAFYSDNSIIYHANVNIGFAIDIDRGLKVLKLPAAGTKNIREIEEDIINISGRYLDDSLTIDDLNDISFIITDLSSESVAFFQPLVNFMNSAILGISSIDEKLERCIFTVTFDHRVTEGKLVARFLKDLKDRLESYRSPHFADQLNDIACFKCFKSLKEDLSDVGFAKCITPKGENAFICQSCLKGF